MDDPNHEYSNLYQLAFFSWAGRIIREIYNTQFGENINLQRQMDPKFTEVSQLFERFKAPILRKDFDTSTKFLSQLKIALTGFKSLPPLFEKTPNAVHEMTLARDIYEHAVVLSVKIEDQDAFERDFCQLKPYYTDTAVHLPPSPQEYPILGLNLLRLLVQNRIAEFHTELELLSASALENPCFKHAVELEQSFMEGAYNRVLTARQTVPHETYVYFMDLLAKTVRDEIAGCIEKAYDSLSLNDARQMLLYSSDKEVVEYVKEEHPEWEIKNGFVFFQRAKESVPCKEIPSLQLINQTLSYARELERIV
ncbi:26S proteasome non-ATPase regulatory subunit 8 homolog A-like isoform X3 [Salvia splendens]|uniref:26S proteasome non-ATPase regulatory subunit 8 homolog A-like isoform X3 n=1 Tax=Salvia splendens TaxID=180675 RepID=UPI001C25524B|nr:26S proteasome non-ATPase regulatory subunit 8 homolog A-like isoform X3 [Salvia splendens]